MDEKDKNIPQPQQPGEESSEVPQPQPTSSVADAAQPAPPTGDPVQPTPQQQPAQPTPQPAQPEQPQQPAQPQQPQPAQPTPQPASAPAAEGQPTQQPAQPTQPPASQPAQPTPQPTQPMPQSAQPTPQPQQPGGGYVPPQPQYTPGAGAGVKRKGTAALVCGIIAIPIALFSPLVSIILGIIAIVLSRRAVRATGKCGKTTAGLICGIAGIVFAIISFIAGLVLSYNILTGPVDNATSYSSSYSSTESVENLSPDEQACYDLGIARLDQLKNQDQALVDTLVTRVDESIAESTGLTNEEMGTNPEDLVRWLLTDFDYSYDGVYVDEEEGTATMYADITMRDWFEFNNAFYDLANDFVDSGEADSMTQDEATKRVGEYFNQAMNETTETTSYYTAIDFVKQSDGTWVIDEDAWDDELGYMFGIY